MKKKNKKIVRYRKPLQFHFSTALFCVIFLYIVIVIVQYVRADKIQIYQVSQGKIANNRSFRGLILREEEVHTAGASGYVNYFVREGSKVRVGATVCTLDQDGQFSEKLAELVDDLNGLSKNDQTKLKEQLTSLSLSYRDDAFYQVAEAKLELESSIVDYLYMAAAEDMEQKDESSMFQKETAVSSGVITYRSDGMEALTAESVSPTLFDESAYAQTAVKSGDQLQQGAPMYRLYTGRTWTVLFQMSAEDQAELADQKTLKIRFSDSGLETAGNFSVINDSEGNVYGQLILSNYATEYLTKRYLDIEILGKQVNGYQIPVSSVVTKDFFTVPENFLTRGGNSNAAGFYQKTYDSNGNESVQFVIPGFYAHKDGMYCISGAGLEAGSVLVKPDSNETYQLGQTVSMQGVYNVNKGYTQFDPIEILGQKEDFYIISPDTDYGVSIYDHIVLNGGLVERENQVIY